MERKKLVKRLVYLIFFILVVSFLANKFYWYSSIWYFDMFVHFLGGLWIGLLGFYILLIKKNSSHEIFKILLFVLCIGIGWEVFEVLVNDVITRNPFDYLDTTSDIFFDILGGFCVILYIWKKLPR